MKNGYTAAVIAMLFVVPLSENCSGLRNEANCHANERIGSRA